MEYCDYKGHGNSYSAEIVHYGGARVATGHSVKQAGNSNLGVAYYVTSIHVV